MAKHIARKRGLYSASQGQLMKTERRRGGLLAACEEIAVLRNRGLDRMPQLAERGHGRPAGVCSLTPRYDEPPLGRARVPA
jgi:hypothetical protein